MTIFLLKSILALLMLLLAAYGIYHLRCIRTNDGRGARWPVQTVSS